jgi:polysaccharide biosynthesis/export protein
MNLKIAISVLFAVLVLGSTCEALAAEVNGNTSAKTVPRGDAAPVSPVPSSTTAQSEPALSTSRQAAPGSKAEAEYRVGPQDLIEIVVYGLPELARTVRVNAQGKISLPLIGSVDATGLTAQGLEKAISERLAEKYLQNPQVTVFIKEFTTLRFTVEGAVNRPGVYPLVGQMTLLRALAVAGGQGPLSEMSEVLLFRVTPAGESTSFKYDATKIRTGEAPDPLIQNDDLVVVNRSKARAAFKDSLFRDILDVLNPIPFLR